MERQRGERDKKTDKNEAVTRREGRRLEKKERQVELRGKRSNKVTTKVMKRNENNVMYRNFDLHQVGLGSGSGRGR